MAVPNEGLTPEQELAIIRAYGDLTKTVPMIAEEAGVSHVTVYKVLHRTGTPLRGPKQRPRAPGKAQAIQAERIAEAVRLKAERWHIDGKEQRWHIDDIAGEIGVTPATVLLYLRIAREETVDVPVDQA